MNIILRYLQNFIERIRIKITQDMYIFFLSKNKKEDYIIIFHRIDVC